MNTAQNKQTKFLKISVVAALGLFISLSLYSSVPSVHAQEGQFLTVSPARQYANIDPGGKVNLTISFLNQATVPVVGNIKALDFIVDNNEGKPNLLDSEALSSRFAAASWVRLPYEKATIPASDILKVPFSITAPKDARPGGRYVAIYFEPTGSLPNQTGFVKEGTMGVTSRIAGLLYLRVNGDIQELALIKSFTAKGFVESGPVMTETEILNRGDYHITPRGQITLQNWFGKVVDTQVFSEVNIFPDASRKYELSLGNKLMIGRYSLTVTTVYGESNKVLSQTRHLWAFPVRIAIVIILTIVIIVLLSKLIWKKLKKNQQKLEANLKEELNEIEDLKKKYQDSISSPKK